MPSPEIQNILFNALLALIEISPRPQEHQHQRSALTNYYLFSLPSPRLKLIPLLSSILRRRSHLLFCLLFAGFLSFINFKNSISLLSPRSADEPARESVCNYLHNTLAAPPLGLNFKLKTRKIMEIDINIGNLFPIERFWLV